MLGVPILRNPPIREESKIAAEGSGRAVSRQFSRRAGTYHARSDLELVGRKLLTKQGVVHVRISLGDNTHEHFPMAQEWKGNSHDETCIFHFLQPDGDLGILETDFS